MSGRLRGNEGAKALFGGEVEVAGLSPDGYAADGLDEMGHPIFVVLKVHQDAGHAGSIVRHL